MTEDDIIEQFAEGKISGEEAHKLLKDLGMSEKDILFNLESLREVDIRLE